MVELINSDPAIHDALVTCDESWTYFYDPGTKRQSSQWKRAGSPRSKKARQSKSILKLLMVPFFWTALAWSTCTGFPLDRQGILCWGFKGDQENIPSEEASTLQIWSVAFPPGQCTSSQLLPCHRLFDQDGQSFIIHLGLWSLQLEKFSLVTFFFSLPLGGDGVWVRACYWHTPVIVDWVGRVGASETLTSLFWKLPPTLPKSCYLFSYIEILENKSKIPECSMSPVKLSWNTW